jgi:predicted NUDIX family NTP pyrophosphohydrolase
MVPRSAGILLFRSPGPDLRVLLVHPGGPLWKHRDLGSWSIPKGEYRPGEDSWAAALREFEEETGVRLAPDGARFDLGAVRQAGGKEVTAFALEGDLDVARVRSNPFRMEWPPGSGRITAFPEIDRAEWFPVAAARDKMIAAQRALIDGLTEKLGLSF